MVAFVAVCLVAFYFFGSPSQRSSDTTAPPQKSYGVVETSMGFFSLLFLVSSIVGKITFQFFPEAAPRTVAQFRGAFETNFYAGCSFYRFEPGFVLQGGCHGVPDKQLPKIPNEYKYRFCSSRSQLNLGYLISEVELARPGRQIQIVRQQSFPSCLLTTVP